MKVDRILVAYILAQGVELCQSQPYTSTEDILTLSEELQASIQQSYRLVAVKLHATGSSHRRFTVEGHSSTLFVSSEPLVSLDKNKRYDLLIKSHECKEILAYVESSEQ